jgi:hypothetical protein
VTGLSKIQGGVNKNLKKSRKKQESFNLSRERRGVTNEYDA